MHIFVNKLIIACVAILFVLGCSKNENDKPNTEKEPVIETVEVNLSKLFFKQSNGDAHGSGTQNITFKISTGMAGSPFQNGNFNFSEPGYFISLDLNTINTKALPKPGVYMVSNKKSEWSADYGHYNSSSQSAPNKGTFFVKVDNAGNQIVRYITSGEITVEILNNGGYRISANLTATDKGVIKVTYEGGLLSENELANSKFEIKTGMPNGNVPGLRYYIFSPVKNENDTKKYPVLFWLHGMGQGGSSLYAPLNGSDVKNFSSPSYQSFLDEGGMYIVVPQNPESSGGHNMSWMTNNHQTGKSLFIDVLNNVIDEVLAGNQVDNERIFLAGFSAGGLMAWQIALNRPSTFVAIVPICPAYRPSNSELEKLVDKNIWIIHGIYDPVCNFHTLTSGVKEKLVELGSSSVRLSSLGIIKNPDGSNAESQHHAWVPVTNNMVFNDGTLYDPTLTGTFLDWLNSCKN